MKYVVDSDFLFGFFVLHDPHHKESYQIFERLLNSNSELITLNLVVQETATVISRKVDQKTSLQFLDKFPDLGLKVLRIDEEIEDAAWEIFRRQTKKGTSFIDCANLAVLEKYKFDGVLSFDEFYPKEVVIKA